MSWDWKALVKTIAPTLGTALGGPAAGAATKFLADKFLGNPDATEQDLAEAVLSASPEQLAEIRRLDNEFKLEMRRLDIDVYRLDTENTKDARSMAKATTLGPQVILSAVFVVGYFAVLFLLFSGKVQLDDGLQQLGYILLGVMTGELPRIMQFWFGSSQGSKDKDKKLTAVP